MSCIAYITDSKMLELHRLNNHKTMNFWRLSNNVSFSDFSIGDLVFFLSKDREHSNKKEKGIVGFGRLKSIEISSVTKMWDKYGELNGYWNLEDFKTAIAKVSKDKKIPKKISSFYLESVTFFQPLYLSECGMNISNNVESYIYLDDEVSRKLLELSKDHSDLWSASENNTEIIDREILLRNLFETHKKIGDVSYNHKQEKAIKDRMNSLCEKGFYQHMNSSINEVYYLKDRYLEIVFYHDRKTDIKALIGQARLYAYHMSAYLDDNLTMVFKTSDDDEDLQYLLNRR
ncbi:MAG: hypothetical protein Q4D13_03570 [Erysipelotrichaceae bacterium]|nr:hypothetical protein [Erysipelotrichaceae bacterium]